MPRRLLAELIGTLLLATIVIGSGCAAQQISPHDLGVQLLENAAATAAGLYVVILVLAPVSGAHLNPMVSVAETVLGRLRAMEAIARVGTQVAGCCIGALLANIMFARPVLELSGHHRASGPHLVAETVASAGLLFVIFGLARTGRGSAAPGAVAAYIGAAYFFTSSTSFANPAMTVGRMLSDTFAGIAPASVPAFVVVQAIGATIGLALSVLVFREAVATSHPG